MDLTDVTFEVRKNVATITLDRPDRMNAGTLVMVLSLLKAFEAVDADDDVPSGGLTGRGRAFCTGADLSGGAATPPPSTTTACPGTTRRVGRWTRRPVIRDGAGLVTIRLFEATMPVVAAINGAAVGMEPRSRSRPTSAWRRASASPSAQRGIVTEGASTWSMLRLVGMDRAA